jgi:ubiquinol-cytochrome c reductase iron-sulfur subunit
MNEHDKSDPAPNKTRRTLVVATSAVGGAAAVGAAVPFLASMWPSERARAAGAPVKVDISGLAPGEL